MSGMPYSTITVKSAAGLPVPLARFLRVPGERLLARVSSDPAGGIQLIDIATVCLSSSG